MFGTVREVAGGLITQAFTEIHDTKDCSPQNNREAHALGGESWHHGPDAAGFGHCAFQPPFTCAAWKAKRRGKRTWTIHCYSSLRGSRENLCLGCLKQITPAQGFRQTASVREGKFETLHWSGNWPLWPLQPILRSQCNRRSSGKLALFPNPNLAIGSSSSSQRPQYRPLASTAHNRRSSIFLTSLPTEL